MNVLKLLSAFLKVNIQMSLAYRADTVVNILLNLMWLGWELLSLNIIFSNTETIGGWGFGELIALLGVFRLVNTMMIALIWPNTEKFNQSIRDGSMELFEAKKQQNKRLEQQIKNMAVTIKQEERVKRQVPSPPLSAGSAQPQHVNVPALCLGPAPFADSARVRLAQVREQEDERAPLDVHRDAQEANHGRWQGSRRNGRGAVLCYALLCSAVLYSAVPSSHASLRPPAFLPRPFTCFA